MSENRLGRETSPYLLQHKDNPVHWWAWGPEALQESQRTGKPILLSVGYAACHWCHVMAHESFEDAETAAVMNALFVNIKVDREERPDIDAIYMSALHQLGQQGGWPLTMFLDTQARPFWGGTYFPKRSQWGRPAFVDVLQGVSRNFHEMPEKALNNAEIITRRLKEREPGRGGPEITDDLIRQIASRMAGLVDPVRGGITGAPKFPQWSFFWLLWRAAIRYGDEACKSAVGVTLANMCQGGIYDHLGGGFARYSTDERWLAPHFEKMLYDNALLLDLMTEVWRETKSPLLKVRIEETAGWVLREMVADGGGFAASLDADSEGEEGRFYVWTADEIARVLGGGEDAALFARVYDVLPAGNWEGHTILNRLDDLDLLPEDQEARLATLRAKLMAVRAGRVRPGWDDKVLADWNGLMIAALARAGVVFGRDEWISASARAFDFISGRMTTGGRLVHSFRDGRGKAPATASDYANMIWAALRLHEATLEPRYLDAAAAWTQVLDQHYWEGEHGGYATSADDTADVIVRLCTATDDAAPNANSVMVSNLACLAALTGEERFRDRAQDILAAFAPRLAQSLVSHTGLLASALDLIDPMQIVISGSSAAGTCDLEAAALALSLPGATLYRTRANAREKAGLLADKAPASGRPSVFVCSGSRCLPPIFEPEQLTATLQRQRKVSGIEN